MLTKLAFSLTTMCLMVLQPSDIQAFTPPDTDAGVEKNEESRLQFDINRSTLKPDSAAIRVAELVDSASAANSLIGLHIEGSSSPDGPEALNARLARKRAEAFRTFISTKANVNDSLISFNIIAENWARLAELYPPTYKIIEAHTDPVKREAALRRHNAGRDWLMLRRDILPQLRYVAAKARYRAPAPIATDTAAAEIKEIEYTSFDTPVEPDTVVPLNPAPTTPEIETHSGPAPPWQRHIYAKTNAPAWAMLWLNAACEIDIAPHWSGQLPIYYSGFNYFTSRRKFRTFTVMPEVRYWLNGDNQGFFAGAHFGFAFFNVAFEGDTRYQDHNGRRPAYGGGMNIGYRFNFCRNKRWKMEISLGAGVYGLYYDEFQNKHNGLLKSTHHRTFFGIDNAAVSFCYQFDLNGRRNTK